ncbi:MAG: hypothetical protein DDT40_00657 [candidate division WS2 bacterium]|nr:hypothetical protein [Candidatus Psychracetigena formicireducens]
MMSAKFTLLNQNMGSPRALRALAMTPWFVSARLLKTTVAVPSFELIRENLRLPQTLRVFAMTKEGKIWDRHEPCGSSQ